MYAILADVERQRNVHYDLSTGYPACARVRITHLAKTGSPTARVQDRDGFVPSSSPRPFVRPRAHSVRGATQDGKIRCSHCSGLPDHHRVHTRRPLSPVGLAQREMGRQCLLSSSLPIVAAPYRRQCRADAMVRSAQTTQLSCPIKSYFACRVAAIDAQRAAIPRAQEPEPLAAKWLSLPSGANVRTTRASNRVRKHA